MRYDSRRPIKRESLRNYLLQEGTTNHGSQFNIAGGSDPGNGQHDNRSHSITSRRPSPKMQCWEWTPSYNIICQLMQASKESEEFYFNYTIHPRGWRPDHNTARVSGSSCLFP